LLYTGDAYNINKIYSDTHTHTVLQRHVLCNKHKHRFLLRTSRVLDTIPWSNTVKYLGLLLDSKLLFTKHLQTILHKATATLLKIFPLLARESPLNIPNKILLYKLLLHSRITYASPVWSSTSLTNYRHLQVYQSKCLRVIGDLPRRTPISNLHAHLQIIPIRQFIHHLTDKFFMSCPVHLNPLIRNTGNYTLEDLHRQYTKYRHKRIKHTLL